MGSAETVDNVVFSGAGLALARFVGWVARLWGQRGLGTCFALLQRLPGLGRARCRISPWAGTTFELAVFEPYWGPVLIGGRAYEPELEHVLRRFAPLEPAFVDCGANIGYWSVRATAPDFGFRRAVAIEPNPSTFAALERHAALNADRFDCVARAISAKSGEVVHLIDTARHAVARIGDDPEGLPVETVTIDEVLEERAWLGGDLRVLLKLDVEGHELRALAGASKTAALDHAVIFEELTQHGFDTFAALRARGYRVFDVGAEGRARELFDVSGAERAARAAGRLGRARNFVACSRDGAFAATTEAWCVETN